MEGNKMSTLNWNDKGVGWIMVQTYFLSSLHISKGECTIDFGLGSWLALANKGGGSNGGPVLSLSLTSPYEFFCSYCYTSAMCKGYEMNQTRLVHWSYEENESYMEQSCKRRHPRSADVQLTSDWTSPNEISRASKPSPTWLNTLRTNIRHLG